MKPLQKGEYDLVNIAALGFDPVTGRSYQECHDEWKVEVDKVIAEGDALRWWQLWKRIKVARKVAILHQRFGM